MFVGGGLKSEVGMQIWHNSTVSGGVPVQEVEYFGSPGADNCLERVLLEKPLRCRMLTDLDSVTKSMTTGITVCTILVRRSRLNRKLKGYPSQGSVLIMVVICNYQDEIEVDTECCHTIGIC